MKVTIENINKYGFVFHKYDSSLIKDSLEETSPILSNYINNLISVKGETLYFDIDTVVKDQEIKPHYHVILGSFQTVVWFPKSPFKGRDYLFGTESLLNKVTPEEGYMCFMKPNDPHFIHGVTQLLSSEPIQTLGYSSLVKPFDDTRRYDTFVENCVISEDTYTLSQLLDHK